MIVLNFVLAMIKWLSSGERRIWYPRVRLWFQWFYIVLIQSFPSSQVVRANERGCFGGKRPYDSPCGFIPWISHYLPKKHSSAFYISTANLLRFQRVIYKRSLSVFTTSWSNMIVMNLAIVRWHVVALLNRISPMKCCERWYSSYCALKVNFAHRFKTVTIRCWRKFENLPCD